MWVAFAKATRIFFSKKSCELDIVLTRTVKILTINKLIKLTMFWTTGPWAIMLLSEAYAGTCIIRKKKRNSLMNYHNGFYKMKQLQNLTKK